MVIDILNRCQKLKEYPDVSWHMVKANRLVSEKFGGKKYTPKEYRAVFLEYEESLKVV